MSTIVTRAGKGAPLTNTELDANFTNLDTDKLEAGDALGTPASVTLTNATGLPTAGLVDNAVTNAKLRDSDGLSVIGRGANSTGDPADIVAGTNHQVLRRDGSSLAFGAVDLSSNQAVTGTLPVANGGTGITSFGSGVATWLGTPSSANLAAAVTDETGTGALVFATSPTLVTPALGTPASGVVTNLTGTASININGTVGATTPAAGAFTTLSSTGNVTLGDASTDNVRVNGFLGVGESANAAFAVSVGSSALTGTSQRGFRSGITATSAATVTAIGYSSSLSTEAASFTLADMMGFYAFNNVAGAGSTITNTHGLYIANQTAGTNNFGITSLVSSGTNKWNIYASGTAANYFAGNVQFAAGTAAAPALTRFGDDNTGIFFPAADTIAFSEGGSERMRITSAGELLIGTTIAASTQGGNLQVITSQAIRRNAASTAGGALRIEKSRSASDGGYTIVQDGDSLGDVQWYGSDGVDFAQAATIRGIVNGTPGIDDMPGALTFLTSAAGTQAPTERLRITSTGNVGIGTNAPSARLHVVSTSGQAPRFAGASSGLSRLDIEATNVADGSRPFQFLSSDSGSLVFGNANRSGTSTTSSTERMRLDSSGRLLLGATAALGTALVQAAALSADPFEGYRFGANANGPSLSLYKNRGASVGVDAVVASGDELGTIAFRGYDGGAYRAGAFITGAVDGTPGASDMPCRLVFSTTADGSATPTERLRITSAGDVGIGTSAPLIFNTAGSSLARLLTVYNPATGAAGRGEIQIGNAATTSGQITGNLLFGCGASVTTANTVGSIYSELTASSTSAATGALVFATASAGTQSEKIRLTSDGYLRMASGSGGIQFNGDTAAANALDDYEEGQYVGTLTPSTSGSITVNGAANYVNYTKIGRQVFISGFLEVGSVSSPVGTYIYLNLPFTIATLGRDSGRFSTAILADLNIVSVVGFDGGTTVQIERDASLITTTDQFYISFNYVAA